MEHIREHQWLFGALLWLSSVLLLAVPNAPAATYFWDGSNNTNFNGGSNWVGGVAPGTSDAASFGSAFTGSNQPNVNANQTIGEIIFASTLAKNVTLSASASRTLTLNGISGVGISNQSSGYSILVSAPLKLGGAQSWEGNSLTVSGAVDTNGRTLTLAPNSGNTFTLSGAITGSGAVTQSGSGTVVYSGSSGNTYTGNTTVNSGELQLNKSSGNAIAGDLIIGDGSGTDVVRLMGSNQINNSSDVTVNSSGQLLLNGAYSDEISNLTMTGGTVNTGTGSLTIVSGAGITSNANATSATIAGNVYLQGAKTISVADGAAAVDLDISANLLDMWYAGVTKTGAGTLRLSGANTFQGTMVISSGVVIAASSGALGASTWNNSIASGAALHLTGGITLSEGSFEFAGTGPDGLGAIRSLAGNNTFNGTLTTTGASTIGIAAGAGLTFGGSGSSVNIDHATTISNSGTFSMIDAALSVGANLTIAGSGSSTISSSSISGSGTIIKQGSGTLQFSGSGTFSPSAMDVQEGTVQLNRFFNPGSQTGLSIGTTSGPAASLQLMANDRLRDDLIITVKESGTFNLNNYNEDIAGMTLYGGTVNTGTGTLTLANAGGDVINAQSSSQTATVNGKIELAQDNLQAVTITVANGSQNTDLNLNAAISQLNPSNQTLLIKAGTGTLEFSGTAANTYTGITRINAGTLMLNKTAGVDAVAGGTIEVNSGGTLLLANANQINNSVNLKLNGGTFSTGETTGFGDKLGTLTLSANSVIDLGSGVHWLEFAASNGVAWTGSTTLTINDWVGVGRQSGTQGRIYFGTDATGLTSAQLAQISFTGFGVGAMLLSTGELVPVPEADVIVAALLIVAALVWRERRTLKRLLAALRMPARFT